jgi:hypothetical protein
MSDKAPSLSPSTGADPLYMKACAAYAASEGVRAYLENEDGDPHALRLAHGLIAAINDLMQEVQTRELPCPAV